MLQTRWKDFVNVFLRDGEKMTSLNVAIFFLSIIRLSKYGLHFEGVTLFGQGSFSYRQRLNDLIHVYQYCL